MNGSALFMMISSMSVITIITGYFMYKVVYTPPKPEPDSFESNDDEKC
ncbi:MAG: hypothetical protein RL222_254 [Bacteroidota bacterium]|jgi:hypothetical protein